MRFKKFLTTIALRYAPVNNILPRAFLTIAVFVVYVITVST